MVESIGAYRLERSLIEGGSGGIHCDSSWMSMGTGIGQITASYQVRIPIPIFSLPLIEYEETMRIKGWTGYEKGGFGKEEDETVYVTETGLVYTWICRYEWFRGKRYLSCGTKAEEGTMPANTAGEKAEDRPILPITATAITVLFPAAA